MRLFAVLKKRQKTVQAGPCILHPAPEPWVGWMIGMHLPALCFCDSVAPASSQTPASHSVCKTVQPPCTIAFHMGLG